VVDHGVPQTTATWELKTQQHFVEFAITNESGTTQETQRGLGLLIANRLAEDMAGTIQMVQEGNSMKTVVRVPWLKRRSL
jgi:two-component sensor histidine kinase